MLSYLNVLHVLKEVRLWVVIVCELDEVPELFFGGKGLHKAGQDGGVIMLHTLVEKIKKTLEESRTKLTEFKVQCVEIE